MWYDVKSYERKCTVRYMFIDNVSRVNIVTQDMRRHRNVVTGNVCIGRVEYNMQQYYAKRYGCNAIIRFKSYKESTWKKKPLKSCTN